jgi:hypothetical protein
MEKIIILLVAILINLIIAYKYYVYDNSEKSIFFLVSAIICFYGLISEL